MTMSPHRRYGAGGGSLTMPGRGLEVEPTPEPVRGPRRRRQWAPVVSAVCLVLLVLGAAAGAGYAIHEKQHSDYCGHQSEIISDVLNVAEYNTRIRVCHDSRERHKSVRCQRCKLGQFPDH